MRSGLATPGFLLLGGCARHPPTVYRDATMVELEGYGHAMLFAHDRSLADRMLGFLEDRRLLPEPPEAGLATSEKAPLPC